MGTQHATYIHPSHWRRAFALLLLAAWLGGCVTVYQPLVGLQRPTVLDPQEENFATQNILVRCVPGPDLNTKQAQALCQKVQTLFINQGANVQTVVPIANGGADELSGDKPDLTIDLRARVVNDQTSLLLGITAGLTLTLVPMIHETTYAQDVVIRDRDGFQLATQTLEARFITYTGIGVWAVTGVLDWLVRSDEEDLGGSGSRHEFSRDLFRQLSQMTFHASMRARVMGNFAEAPAADANAAAATSTNAAPAAETNP